MWLRDQSADNAFYLIGEIGTANVPVLFTVMINLGFYD
jgi:hypothetical protein